MYKKDLEEVEAHLRPCQIFLMKLFVRMVNEALAFFALITIIRVLLKLGPGPWTQIMKNLDSEKPEP